MKLLNAWTLELDEPEIAVSEILEQLDLVRCECSCSGSGLVRTVRDLINGAICALSDVSSLYLRVRYIGVGVDEEQ